MSAKPATCGPDVLSSPEFADLRALRRRFARGGLPPVAERTAEDDARITAYNTLAELLRVLMTFRDRTARGERVRLVMPEQLSERGRARIEIWIEEGPA